MGKPWDADAARPGSPTSMDVLLRWLRTPGNYKRWQTQAKKLLVEEIIAELKREDTCTRSPSSVRHKIFKLQHQYELAAVFETKTCNDADIDNDAEGTNAVKEIIDETEVTRVVAEEKPATRSTQGKRKRASKAQAPRTAKREKVPAPIQPALVQADEAKVEHTPDQQANDPFEKSLALTEFQKRSESRWNEYLGAKTTCGLSDSESQRLLNREMEHADAFAKLRLDAEAKRQELQTICAKALLRQNLRKSGLSEDQVDSCIPK